MATLGFHLFYRLMIVASRDWASYYRENHFFANFYF